MIIGKAGGSGVEAAKRQTVGVYLNLGIGKAIIGQEVNGLHQSHSFWSALMKTTLLRMQLFFSLLNTKMQKNSTKVRINILDDNPADMLEP